ncbi:MAG: DUF1329 domain-containing protein [Deltaproteobacteria bacterium]|nr:MAG: DUF1329 domain-containing protein [Deltaproteobacteria bacterium]
MRLRRAAVSLMAVAGLELAATPLRADVSPGQVVGKQDLAAVRTLISPSIEWILDRGATMKIVEKKPIGWPKAYADATEKYAGQVRLAPNGLTLEHYIAGQPFPNLDPTDQAIAVKVMWNYEYRPYPGTDDFVEYDFPSWDGSLNKDTAMTVERELRIGEARRLYYNGRLVVDPKPEIPNPAGYRFQEFVGPVLSPFDLKGVGLLTYRFVDPGNADASFLYLPVLRRVRRLSTAQRSDALLGTDADPNNVPAPQTSCSATCGRSDPCTRSRDDRNCRSTLTASGCSTSTGKPGSSPTRTSTTAGASSGRCGSTTTSSVTRHFPVRGSTPRSRTSTRGC